MIQIIKTNSKHSDFIALVKQLDAYLKITDGDEHDFYNQFNSIDNLKHVVIAYQKNSPIACGAFKEFSPNSIEIKRMYTTPEARGNGVASKILVALEEWGKALGYTYSMLETGKRQAEAVNFYKKNNYLTIPNYGQYQDMENSICFKKHL